MKVLISGSSLQLQEIKQLSFSGADNIVLIEQWNEAKELATFDAFFILNGEGIAELWQDTRPLFVNEVVATFRDLANAPASLVRINGWPGFLQRSVWEAAGNINEVQRQAAAAIGRKLIAVKDVPGLVAATVVSMIINEAAITLNAGLSTEKEIDLAMKSATNYPFGPFEWGEKIGWHNVHHLLERLSIDDDRYTPSFTL